MMKLSQKIALSITIATGAAVLLYLLKKPDTTRMLSEIADEGYETANDILFPGQTIGNKHLRYGPILPD